MSHTATGSLGGGGDDDEPARNGRGTAIVGRYRLDAILGRGSYGEVWSAEDTVTGRRVAVKLLFPHVDLALARAQLEVAALRQRLPGVVELLDDGNENGQAFLVMELVLGLPFPGCARPCAWDDIADVAVALLETLARVHAAFVVHRDLKPANVLVTADKQVRLLDFGIAYRPSAALNDTLDGSEMIGTPAYMAPEQLRGQRVTERTDLYALGVMLYESLAGRPPHQGANPGQLLHARLNLKAPPLEQAAPSVPGNVARLVDRMIALLPESRPASAFEVLAILRGERSVEDPLFPWVGSQAALMSVVEAARQRRSVDLVGPRGSGRTRWLLAVEQALKESARVHWVGPAEAAFASLVPVTGPLDPAQIKSLAEAAREVDARLGAALSAGDVILADDAAGIDPWSRAALARARRAGSVIRALEVPADDADSVVRLGPLAELDLRSLFAGPDRLLHLREDAAHLLHQRTDGVPARVVREISTWLSLGIAKWTRNVLIVPRDALDRLATGLLDGAPAEADAKALRDLPTAATDMLVWASLAWPHSTVPLLAKVTGTPQFQVEADIERLAERGLVRLLSDGRILSRVPPQSGEWSEGRVRTAHAAIAAALAPGVVGRLLHLMVAGAKSQTARLEIAHEAAALATRLVDEGRLGGAVASIESGLRAVRDMGPDADAERACLFGLWVEAALEEGSPAAVDRLRHTLCRADRSPQIAVVEALTQAIAVEEYGSKRALDLARAIPPQQDARLERVRISARLNAARLRADDDAEEQFLDELLSSGAAIEPDIAARVDHARGRLRYRQGRFLEAAALHAAAARSASVLQRIASKNAGSWALLEAFALDEALALATEARALAEEHRHAAHETAATWTLRAVAHRTHTAHAPDMELVGAVRHAAGRHIQGAIVFNEAAIAWRAGRSADALPLARQSHELLAAIDEQRGAPLMRCLMVVLGHPTSAEEARSLLAKALDMKGGGLGVQALALLAMGNMLPPDAVDEARLAALAAEVPRAFWRTPLDILSVDESLEAIRKTSPVKAPTAESVAGSRRECRWSRRADPGGTSPGAAARPGTRTGAPGTDSSCWASDRRCRGASAPSCAPGPSCSRRGAFPPRCWPA